VKERIADRLDFFDPDDSGFLPRLRGGWIFGTTDAIVIIRRSLNLAVARIAKDI
jgi:hypothetical protein